MHIVTKIKLDQKQQTYWSAMLMHHDACIIEIHSEVFDPVDKFQYWQCYERCMIRMAKEIAKEKDQAAVMSLLIQEEIKPINQSVQT